MYFSRITIKPQMEIFRLLQSLSQNLYSSHQLLWSLFPGDKEAERDFIFRQEIKNNMPQFYMLSERKPDSRQDYIIVESKPYEPVIKKGSAFYFNIRLNPVVAKKKEEGAKSSKHDIWLNAKKMGQASGLKDKEITAYIQTEVKKWFAEKCTTWGFSVEQESLEITRYIPHLLWKKGQSKPIRFSTVDYAGVLKVTDPELFRKNLLAGIGRARAFGCGLLLIKRI